MNILIGKPWLALGAFLIGMCPSLAPAERSMPVTVLSFQLACDPDQCRTPVLEIHEHTGIDANYLEYVFAPPPGITLDDAHTSGVEVDGGGDTHYVRALDAAQNWLRCKWLAKARSRADPGLAKGYCWIAVKKQ
jgi:hypothetical protein